jgi:hypothetical protein
MSGEGREYLHIFFRLSCSFSETHGLSSCEELAVKSESDASEGPNTLLYVREQTQLNRGRRKRTLDRQLDT